MLYLIGMRMVKDNMKKERKSFLSIIFFKIILIFVTVNQSFTNSGNRMSKNPEINQPTKSICLRCSLFNELPRAHAHRTRRRRRKAARRTRTSKGCVFSYAKTPQKRTHESGVLSSNQNNNQQQRNPLYYKFFTL